MHAKLVRPACRAIALLMLGVIADCATPYQEMGLRGGYVEEQVAGGAWWIGVDVNLWTAYATSIAYSYHRASDLCPSGFEVLDKDVATFNVAPVVASAISLLLASSIVTRHSSVLVVRCRNILAPAPRIESERWWCTDRGDGFGLCMPTRAQCQQFQTGTGGADYQACKHRDSAVCTSSDCFNTTTTCTTYERKLGRDGSACIEK